MAWANVDDVQQILPDDESIPPSGRTLDRVETNLEEATDLVSAFLGRVYEGDDDDADDVPDDVPAAVRRVVARVALRAFIDEPDYPGAQGVTNAMGPFSTHINWAKEATSRDFMLTDTDELRLSPYTVTTTRAVGHAPMVGTGCEWWA